MSDEGRWYIEVNFAQLYRSEGNLRQLLKLELDQIIEEVETAWDKWRDENVHPE